MDEITSVSGRGALGRTRRPRVELVPLKARVGPAAHSRAHQAAAALGVTMAEYVEALILHDDHGPDGRPLWWDKPAPRDQQELPLTRSA